jgi:predicted ATPase/DNA-binding winged helix-turn-helix (wHTH) protein
MITPAARSRDVISFGPFSLVACERLLTREGVPVELGARALDTLIALVDRPNEVVSKSELLAQVWPDVTVDEGSLRVHIAGLRKALGDGKDGARYITTLAGRGYCFVAPTSRSSDRGNDPSTVAACFPPGNLPNRLIRMVGRADDVLLLSTLLTAARFVTVVSAGGVGKTTVAIEVGHRLTETFPGAVLFVDLGMLNDPNLVATAVASMLGLSVHSDDATPSLIAYLRDKRILLILDTCEHLIEATATLASRIFTAAPQIHILATSREALRVEGEHVYKLDSLACPPDDPSLTAAVAQMFPATQLFTKRAAANVSGFKISDTEAPIIAEICRRLDGIALAIELAAGRIDTFGVRGLAALLDDRFRLLTGGRRTGMPRHQTLTATLDWSYELLPDSERKTLRRVAIFTGGFTLEAAKAIAADSKLFDSDVIGEIANLVAKSLIVANTSAATPRFRLLDTTRAYLVRKLRALEEFESLARRHAEHYRDLFEQAETDRERLPAAEWLEVYGFNLDNVRSALDWAFSPRGEASLGIDLTLAATSLWTHLSLSAECRSRVETALRMIGDEAGSRREMALFAKLASALLFTAGADSDVRRAWTTVLALAEKIGDTDYQLRALWGLWVVNIKRAEFRDALALAEHFHHVASTSTNTVDALIGERIIGLAYFYLGDPATARLHLERMLSSYIAPADRSHILRYEFDQGSVAGAVLSAILWLQGYADQAKRMIKITVDEAIAIGHPTSEAYVLVHACAVALLIGELSEAEQLVARFFDRISLHGLVVWTPFARAFQGVLFIKQGNSVDGSRILEAAIREFPENSFHLYHTFFIGELAEGLGRSGERAKGLMIIDEAIDQSDRSEERWYISELLRIKGAIILGGEGSNAADESERQFLTSLEWARRQGLLAWELRTATSLAQSWREQGRRTNGLELVKPIYDRFTEGFDTFDLKRAKVFLDDCA